MQIQTSISVGHGERPRDRAKTLDISTQPGAPSHHQFQAVSNVSAEYTQILHEVDDGTSSPGQPGRLGWPPSPALGRVHPRYVAIPQRGKLERAMFLVSSAAPICLVGDAATSSTPCTETAPY